MAKKEYGTRKKYHYIYKTTNIVSGRYYIGMHSTDNLEDGYLGSGTLLKRSINKHGKESHSIEILEFLNSREELSAREKEIISLQEIAKKECMNLKVGGRGGFSKEQSSKGRERVDEILRQKYGEDFRSKVSTAYHNSLDTQGKELFKQKIREGQRRIGFEHNTFQGRKHTPETIEKMRNSKKGQGTGTSSSQYGTCWITNESESRKIHKGDTIPEGWRLGRKIKMPFKL